MHFQLIANLFGWALLKNIAESIANISRVLTNGLNYKVALTLWFLRALGLTGILVCLNEAVLLRYVTKIVLKRIIIMNDALVGTWITLSNFFIAIVLTIIQTQNRGFLKNLGHLTNENLESMGSLIVASHTTLGVLHVILAIVIVIHVSIDKFKARHTTPVIQINIPNPQAGHQPMINNQPYNNDLFDFSTYFCIVLLNAICFFPFLIVLLSNNVSTFLAESLEISAEDFFRIATLVRNFIHAFVLGFLSPLVLMSLSDELRPFLCSCLSCSNDEMIEVYN